MAQAWKEDALVEDQTASTWQSDALVEGLDYSVDQWEVPTTVEDAQTQPFTSTKPDYFFKDKGMLQNMEEAFTAVSGPNLGIDNENYGAVHDKLGFLTPIAHAAAAGIEGIGGGIAAGASGISEIIGGEELRDDVLAATLESPTVGGGVTTLAAGPRMARMARTAQTTPKPIRQIPSAADVALTEEQGIRVLTSDIKTPETFAAKWMQNIGEKIPVFGTGPLREAQQLERTTAINSTLKQFGVDDVAKLSDDVMKNLTNTRSKAIQKHSKVKTDIFNALEETGAVDVSKTTQAIQTEIKRLEELGGEQSKELIAFLTDQLNTFPNKTIGQVEELRRRSGEALGPQGKLAHAGSEGEKIMGRIYPSIREDIGDFVLKNGGAESHKKWSFANEKLSGMIEELNKTAFKSALNNGKFTPEVIRGLLFSKKPSDVRILFKNLSPKGRKTAMSAIVSEAANNAKTGEVISPQKFLTQLQKMDSQFGTFFKGDDLLVMKGLERALKLTERASVSGVAPPTGVQNAIPMFVLALSDLLGTSGAAVFGGISTGSAARGYESKVMRNMLMGLSKAKQGSKEEQDLTQKLLEGVKRSKDKQ